MSDPSLRIACLEPSATAICLALGLQESLVGVTHECEDLVGHLPPLRVLTKNGLTVTSQGDIHRAVQDAAAKATCALTTDSQAPSVDDIPSLYPLLGDEIQVAEPTVIFTQNLCSVCAPTEQDVQQVLLEQSNKTCQVISLQPHSLAEVAETFLTVAEACGVLERGVAFRTHWLQQFQQLQTSVESNRDPSLPKPRLLILEWLDPPFDAGHWTYQMMEYAGVTNAHTDKHDPKSKQISWSSIEDWDPDVILVGCCGFDLERNVEDSHLQADQLQRLRASREQRLFACNGNSYIAQPGPSLLQGAVVLAKCAYHDQPKVLEAIDQLGILTPDEEATAWKQVNVMNDHVSSNKPKKEGVSETSPIIADIEDLVTGGETKKGEGFAALHDLACKEGKHTYTDPETGYNVFTAIAHRQRGWCCGSGCRHCPYSHENVKDKASKIQEPSLLYRQSNNGIFSVEHPKIKVLFFSGGKDSFLTIRSLVRQYHQESFGLVLLTTFDATTRKIAHQEIPIDDVIRQAKHLDITLLGVPLRRGSGETYKERIQHGLAVIQKALPVASQIQSLVFGDLHLEHIQEWRNNTLTDLCYQLEYPLWKVPYATLMDDLETSQVPCFVSGSTVDAVPVGTPFDRRFYEQTKPQGLDGFGEQGEFHSIAQVWEVSKEKALGIAELI